MLLYIIRHGDPDYSTDSLVPRGVQQAEAVAQRLAKVGIDRIFTSPMGRARQTAEPLCNLLGLEYQVEEWAREIALYSLYPDGEKKSIPLMKSSRFRENGNWDISASQSLNCPVFHDTDTAEKFSYIEEGGRGFLERLGYKEEGDNYRILWPNEEKVALFCHGNFSRVWLSSLLKVPLHIMLGSFGINHTGVTVLRFENHEDGITAPRCLCYGDISHLYTYGLDTRFNDKWEI